MRLVVFSDLHLDAPFAWLGANQAAARKRRQALRDTLVNVVKLAESIGADALLCGGDLYEHDRATPDTAQFLRSTFAQIAPLPVYIAPGNHDWYGPDSLYHRLEWSTNVHVFRGNRFELVALSAKQPTPPLVLAGAAVALVGLVVLALGLVTIGAGLLVLGAVVTIWSFQSHQAARVRAVENLIAAEQALEGQQHRRGLVDETVGDARHKIETLSIPPDPMALECLADQVRDATRAGEAAETWENARKELVEAVTSGETSLRSALIGRGLVVGDSLVAAHAGYQEECQRRAMIAKQAAVRPGLEQQLATRQLLESTAEQESASRASAESKIRHAAQLCGVSGDTPDNLVSGLVAWQESRAAELKDRGQRIWDWHDLKVLLHGKTIDELRADVARTEQRARDLANGCGPTEIEETILEDDLASQIDNLNRAVSEADGEYQKTGGTLEERGRALASVAEAEEALAATKAELDRVQQLEATLKLTRTYLERAKDRTHRLIAPKLAASAARSSSTT